jgi:glycosyltransferase involved in cell wall biosynthesis
MKILYLCPDLGIPILGRKGASIHVRSLASALSRAGHTVMVACPVLTKSPWDEPAPLQATLLHLPPDEDSSASVATLKALNETLGVVNTLPGELRRILYNRELGRRLKRRFEAHPPDVIYERASLYATAGATLAREWKRPHVVELNAPLALEQATYRGTSFGDLAALAERWLLTQADAVLTVSAPLREYVIALGVDADRVHVHPNGVDAALFHPAPIEGDAPACRSANEGPVLGFLGGLRPWHGVEVLPDVLARLLPHHPGLRLVIVGEGPLRADLERDVRERGLSGSVVFTGSVPHERAADVLREFNIALAPYPRIEHDFYFSPLKVFEYMACGLPVVAARVGQIAEVIQHGETGLLYSAGDVEALTAACDRLLAEPSLRRRLGQAAAREVLGRYTWDQNATRVTELAAQLIRAKQGTDDDPANRLCGQRVPEALRDVHRR